MIKTKSIGFVLMTILAFTLTVQTTFAKYETLETIPGVQKGADFPSYVTGIYNFAIAIVLIAALLMITLGGFYYITSAGNQAQAGTAKKLITDALLGLVVVFLIYLVLNTINPDLMNSASPNLGALQSGIETNSSNSSKNIQSTKHTSSRVIQEVKQPQSYCMVDDGSNGGYPSVECFQSKGACNDPACVSAQEAFSNEGVYECAPGDPRLCRKHDNMSECEADEMFGCSLGVNAKAEMLNNVKSEEQINTEIESAGGEMTREAKKDANQMTEKTNKNVQEIIKQSEGGTITEVNQNGAEYKMQGVSKESDNGTQYATRGKTLKGLQKIAKNSEDDMVTKYKEKKGNITYYKYEFSPDHPNEELRGTVATYTTIMGTDEGLPTYKYSDVTIVAAQEIKPKA